MNNDDDDESSSSNIFPLKPKRSSNEFLHDGIELMRQQLDKADEGITKLMVTVFRGGFRSGVYQAKRELLLEMKEGKEYITREEIERQFEPEFEKWAEEWYRKAVGFDEEFGKEEPEKLENEEEEKEK